MKSHTLPALPKHILNVIDTYPSAAQNKLLKIRQLIFTVALQDGIDDLSETLKWGEPSYSCKSGSTIRMDWKAKTPEVVYVFFHCQTKLVNTFREIFGDELVLEGNRAIVFNLDDALPTDIITQCVSMALRYHDIKQLPLLGYGGAS